MSERKKWWNNEKAAIRTGWLLILIWGVIMTFLMPSWQTPDEHTHLKQIGESWGNYKMADVLMNDMSMEQARMLGQYEEKIDIVTWRGALTKKPGYSRTEVMPSGIRLSVVKHLPASIGIFGGLLFHLPTFWVMELGELFALAFAVFIYALSLKLMPVKREVLLLLMAFPMTMQQISSINYDSVLLPLCFLFVAYIFYLCMKKEKVGWKEIGISLLLIVVIAYIKVPYALLALLFFIVPKEKISLRFGKGKLDGEVIRRWRIPAIVCLILLICAGLYIGRDNQWVRILLGMMQEGHRSLYLFNQTVHVWWRYLLISGVGQFGWLDSAVPFAFALFSYMLVMAAAVCGREENSSYTLNCKARIWMWIIFLILCVMICMSMVNHTIMMALYGSESAAGTYDVRQALYQIAYIGGLQGRYFLPFLMLPFLALPETGKKIKLKLWIVDGYLVAAAILTITILIRRYWIV